MINKENVEKLIAWYKENPPRGWGVYECITHAITVGCGFHEDGLSDIGVISKFIGINLDDAYNMYYASNERTLSAPWFIGLYQSPQQNQANVIGMLQRLIETGTVEWRHETIQ